LFVVIPRVVTPTLCLTWMVRYVFFKVTHFILVSDDYQFLSDIILLLNLPTVQYTFICFSYLSVQKVKTSVIKKTVNPVWNEDLTLAVRDAATPIKLVSICIQFFGDVITNIKLMQHNFEFF
jgi:hypothetical protein